MTVSTFATPPCSPDSLTAHRATHRGELPRHDEHGADARQVEGRASGPSAAARATNNAEQPNGCASPLSGPHAPPEPPLRETPCSSGLSNHERRVEHDPRVTVEGSAERGAP